jgi:hypothetical protein
MKIVLSSDSDRYPKILSSARYESMVKNGWQAVHAERVDEFENALVARITENRIVKELRTYQMTTSIGGYYKTVAMVKYDEEAECKASWARITGSPAATAAE